MRISLVLCLIASYTSVKAAPPRRSNKGCLKRKPTLTFRIGKDNLIDLTHVTNEFSAYWPSNPTGFQLIEQFKGFVTDPMKFFYSSNEFSQPEHLGTHMDAPIHFSENGNGVHEVSLEKMIGNGILLDLTSNGERFNESLVTQDHFLNWERKRAVCRIQPGSIILLRTGYGDFYDNRPEYLGTNKTGSESIPFLNFPGLDPDAAKWLIEKLCIAAIGIDTPSIDEGQSKTFLSHQILAASSIPIFENVANLDKVAKRRRKFNVIALPYKMEGATGAPVRIVAVMN